MILRALRLSLLLVPIVASSACVKPRAARNPDHAITGRVGDGLGADPEVRRYTIEIATVEGVVYLRGKVDSQTLKASAERIAESTDGVERVVNDLVVAPKPEAPVAPDPSTGDPQGEPMDRDEHMPP